MVNEKISDTLKENSAKKEEDYMMEYKVDKLLHIRTRAEKKVNYPDSIQYNPYEPTPYHALETLFQHYELIEEDEVVDYGCGKGRLNFYIHYFFGSSVKGIEMDENFYQDAIIKDLWLTSALLP